MTYPAQMKTPIEVSIPMLGIQDHGLSLVHEIGGQPRNYLHEVSIEQWEQDAVRYLEAAGYAYRCGWVKDGKAFSTYSKAFPLTVATWEVKQ